MIDRDQLRTSGAMHGRVRTGTYTLDINSSGDAHARTTRGALSTRLDGELLDAHAEAQIVVNPCLDSQPWAALRLRITCNARFARNLPSQGFYKSHREFARVAQVHRCISPVRRRAGSVLATEPCSVNERRADVHGATGHGRMKTLGLSIHPMPELVAKTGFSKSQHVVDRRRTNGCRDISHSAMCGTIRGARFPSRC